MSKIFTLACVFGLGVKRNQAPQERRLVFRGLGIEVLLVARITEKVGIARNRGCHRGRHRGRSRSKPGTLPSLFCQYRFAFSAMRTSFGTCNWRFVVASGAPSMYVPGRRGVARVAECAPLDCEYSPPPGLWKQPTNCGAEASTAASTCVCRWRLWTYQLPTSITIAAIREDHRDQKREDDDDLAALVRGAALSA